MGQCFLYTLFWWKSANSPRSSEFCLHSFLHFSTKNEKSGFTPLFPAFFVRATGAFSVLHHFSPLFLSAQLEKSGFTPLFPAFLVNFAAERQRIFHHIFPAFLLEKTKKSIFFPLFFCENFYFSTTKKILKKKH